MSRMTTTSSVDVMTAISLVLALAVLVPTPALAAQTGIQAQTVKPTPFSVCIDDSDCNSLGQGSKYACFQYLCYPWKDDSHIQPDHRRQTCRVDADCQRGHVCYRHHDMRNINRGICFEEILGCDTHTDCPRGLKCCSGGCCEERYFTQFKKLPCSSHLGCEDLGLGKFCCPRANTTSQCCDTDPNPPRPVQTGLGGPSSAASNSLAFSISAAASVALLVAKMALH